MSGTYSAVGGELRRLEANAAAEAQPARRRRALLACESCSAPLIERTDGLAYELCPAGHEPTIDGVRAPDHAYWTRVGARVGDLAAGAAGRARAAHGALREVRS